MYMYMCVVRRSLIAYNNTVRVPPLSSSLLPKLARSFVWGWFWKIVQRLKRVVLTELQWGWLTRQLRRATGCSVVAGWLGDRISPQAASQTRRSSFERLKVGEGTSTKPDRQKPLLHTLQHWIHDGLLRNVLRRNASLWLFTVNLQRICSVHN